MPQPSLAPPTPFVERIRARLSRRAIAIGLVAAIEGLMLLLLLSLGAVRLPGKEEDRTVTVMRFEAAEASQEAPEPASREPERQSEARPAPERPQTPAAPSVQPAAPQAAPPAPVPMPVPPAPALRVDIPGDVLRPGPAAPRPAYGPADSGRPAYLRDTEQVGTMPGGEPLYAAAWYREPRSEDLRAYLSTARGPGWGLIACRTAPNYRVEDCVPLDEYPAGSQMNRAILAAAWEFRVRPPRRGGQSLVGAWVRIRIDYEIR